MQDSCLCIRRRQDMIVQWLYFHLVITDMVGKKVLILTSETCEQWIQKQTHLRPYNLQNILEIKSLTKGPLKSYLPM